MTDTLARLTAALADRYRIERELGAGGMATVYLAEDLKHHRNVAIKVLRPELAAALGPERFLREIEIAARLNHPHILPLFDSGEADGFLFYVMPYAEGESLRDRLIREKQLPVDDALQISREVADALGFAHSRDVVHRDIKPENILLEAGHAVVADFGIARAISAAGGERLTETGFSVGTPHYMSPEQAAGGRDLDGRSDVYSLGCVLYEMLGGQPPFTGATADGIVRQHLTVEPPSVTNLRPATPAELDDTLAKALAKTPADRFPTAAEFVAALDVEREPGPKRAPPLRLRWTVVSAVAVVGMAIGFFVTRTARASPEPALTIVAAVEGSADGDLRSTIRELIGAAIDQSEILMSIPSDQLQRGLALADKADSTTLDLDVARELAIRGSIRSVVASRLERVGQTHSLTVRVIDAEDGSVIAAEQGVAEQEEDLIPTVDAVVRELRAALGERRSVVERNRPLIETATPSLDAYRNYAAARERQAEGDITGAVRLLSEAVTIDPEFADAWFEMAGQLREQGRLDSADAAHGRGMQYRDRLSEAGRLRLDWRMAREAGDRVGALRAVDSYLERHRLDPLYHQLRGTALWEAGRRADAVAAYERAVALSPFGAPDHWLGNLALIYVDMGRLEDAKRVAQRRSPARRLLSESFIAAVEHDWVALERTARAFANDATNETHRRIRLMIGVASAQAVSGRIGAAENTIWDARELANRDGLPRYATWAVENLLFLASASGHSVTPRPSSLPQDDVARAIWESGVGDSIRARRLIQAATPRRRTDTVTVELAKVSLAARSEDWTGVVDLLEGTSRLGRLRWVVQWLLGDAYERLDRIDEAAEQFRWFVEVHTPTNTDGAYAGGIPYAFAHRRLARLYTRMGQYDVAEEHWRAFLDVFTEPDAEVQWMVDEARAEVARLEEG